jgi:hypothetical protein
LLSACIAAGCSSNSDVDQAEPDAAATSRATTASTAAAERDDESQSGVSETTAAVATAPPLTDPTLPATTTIAASGIADVSIAQVVVDGTGYDLCASTQDHPALAELLGGAPLATPKTLDELAAALGLNAATEAVEGAVSCGLALEGDTSTSTVIRAWTDDSLRFSLSDPSATAASRAELMRESQWSSDDPFGSNVANDLVGLGEGGWSGHTNSEYVAVAWQGPVLLSFSTSYFDGFCEGDVATATACHAERLAPTTAAFSELFPELIEAFTGGQGVVARFPDTPPPAAVATVATTSGPKDLCALAAGHLALLDQAVVYQPASGGNDVTAFVDEEAVEGGARCEFEGLDRDFDRGVYTSAFGVDVPLAEGVYRSDVEMLADSLEPVAGIGDEAMGGFATLLVLDRGIYLYASVGSTSLDTGESLRAALTAYAQALLADLSAA